SMQDRMTGKQFVVVNPDQTAVVLWQRDEYTTAEYGDYSYDLRGGQSYYLYEDIDYFFTAFPEEIQLPSGVNSAYRTRLSTMREQSDADRIEALLNNEKLEAAATFAARKLRHEPDASALLNYAAYVLPKETILELVESKLNETPILIEYHRHYQHQNDAEEAQQLLKSEYQQRLAKDPDNKALTYLLARVEEDPATSLELFKEAFTGEGAEGYAAFALAYHTILYGMPAKSEALIDEAIQRGPDNAKFTAFREFVWMANKNYGAMAKQAELELKIDPYDVSAFYKKLTADCSKNPDSDGKLQIGSFISMLAKDGVYDRETAENLRSKMMAHASILTGDLDGYRTHLQKTPSEGNEYILALLDGRIEAARELLERDELDLSGNSHLLLYSLAMQQNNNILASECLQTANEYFANGSKENRKWAKWMTGDEAPQISELLDSCQNIEHHYAVLVAFAQRFPEQSSAYMKHARKICYKKDFTYLALKPVLKL
ncbi:MAG: tetratricopeptide repeat protein, partial [Opitutales bacterium]